MCAERELWPLWLQTQLDIYNIVFYLPKVACVFAGSLQVTHISTLSTNLAKKGGGVLVLMTPESILDWPTFLTDYIS